MKRIIKGNLKCCMVFWVGIAVVLMIVTLQPLRKTWDQGFGNRLKAAIQEVNQNQHSADNAIEKVIKGELGIHEGMIALGKADRSMKLLLQIRNKVMEVYKEISRMPV